MGSLSLQGIQKSFGKTEVLKGINLEIADGEFVVFVGPSGCGKSTLLRIVAGLESPTVGHVQINDNQVTVQRLFNGDNIQFIPQCVSAHKCSGRQC